MSNKDFRSDSVPLKIERHHEGELQITFNILIFHLSLLFVKLNG